MSALFELGVVETADAIADGSLSAETATSAALERLAAYGPALNAVVSLDPEGALARARATDLARARGEPLGPLAGVPMAHKDLLYRAGRPCAGGSLIRRDFVPDETAVVLERLDSAGAIDLGRLQLAEFALSPTGLNAHYGHGRNPWNPDYCSGGSSSGSGAAVAARLVPAALGSDTGGSIRHPAAMCGITGVKPTHGLVPLAGAMPLAPSLDSIGPLCRSARDAARLLSVIAGPSPRDGSTVLAPRRDYEAGLSGDLKGLSIAVPEPYYREAADADILALLDDSLKVLAERGARIVRTAVRDMAAINSAMQLMMAVEAATLHRRWIEERPDDYGAQVLSRIAPGLAYPATRYVEAVSLRGPLTADWLATAMGEADMVHIPTLPVAVPSIAATTEGSAEAVAAALGRVTHCTRAINYLGLPSVAVPCGFAHNGLPASFQLVGRPFGEAALLRAADAYQRVTPFHRAPPPGYGAP
ncbi:amidase [Xanthobacter sp. ZOL 2024]